MNDQLWYPQLDVYDCIRRLGALLSAFEESPGIERLCIADFYLANPPLLHLSTMKKETRRRFDTLRIVRPQKAFLAYPAPLLLFGKMAPIQKEALTAMRGKGLLFKDDFCRGIVTFSQIGADTFESTLTAAITGNERELIDFITGCFASISEVGSRGLRKSTGLRRLM